MRRIKATDKPFRKSASLLNLLKKQERSLFLIFKVLFKVLFFLLYKSENSFTEKQLTKVASNVIYFVPVPP